MLSLKIPQTKRAYSKFEKIGIVIAVLLGTPVILAALIIFIWGLLQLFDSPRPGM